MRSIALRRRGQDADREVATRAFFPFEAKFPIMNHPLQNKKPNTDQLAGTNIRLLQRRLKDWFSEEGRALPWRKGGRKRDPYRVWLSEIMLQQTTVKTVTPYFESFCTRWPTVQALAAVPLEDVLHAWAGLGYYARARNLKACAETVTKDFDGQFPESPTDLQKLPGIGAYTAAAIAAIAFDRPAAVIDGNIERVIARLFAIDDDPKRAKARIREYAALLTPAQGAGDHAEAMMDLGAIICRPTSPDCEICPVAGHCLARRLGIAEDIPVRPPRPALPRRSARVYWLERDGQVRLRRRPAKGLLGGMLEFPATPWEDRASPLTEPDIVGRLSPSGALEKLPGGVSHTFTHFHLDLEIFTAKADSIDEGPWVAVDDLEKVGLPTLMLKIARHGRRHRRPAD